MVRNIPNPIDLHVAGRLRLRRLQLGMSQEDLARSLNIPVQQVQAYETGASRIGASRLQNLATLLRVPIPFFYEEGLEIAQAAKVGPGAEAARLAQAMSASEIVGFIQLMAGFRSPRIRRCIRELAMAVAEELRDNGSPNGGLTQDR